MKANELMIGDWVCYNRPNNYCTKVVQIRNTDDPFYDCEWYIEGKRDLKDPIYQGLDFFSCSILSPILLTSEILEKNGFKRDENWHWCLYDYYSKIVLYEHSDSIWVFVYENTEFADLPCTQNVISYVHELQHILKLCGIDKGIEL